MEKGGGSEPEKATVAENLDATITSYRRWRGFHHWCSNSLTVLSILASAILTVLSAAAVEITLFQKLSLLTVLAALPGVMIALNTTIKFGARALWFDQMVTNLVIIDRALDVGEIDDREAVRQWSSLELQMQPAWEGILRPSPTPSAHHRNPEGH
jgi:hypothetical protein